MKPGASGFDFFFHFLLFRLLHPLRHLNVIDVVARAKLELGGAAVFLHESHLPIARDGVVVTVEHSESHPFDRGMGAGPVEESSNEDPAYAAAAPVGVEADAERTAVSHAGARVTVERDFADDAP